MVPERTQPRANPARGLALIATAVIVGLFLLRNWDGTGGGVAAANGNGEGGNTEVTTPGQTTVPGGGEQSATTVAARPPTEVTVRVLNATDVQGAASRLSDLLEESNYIIVESDNAGTMLDATKILFAAGYEREAAELARSIASPAENLEALANPPQVDPNGAQLVVLLGKDIATKG